MTTIYCQKLGKFADQAYAYTKVRLEQGIPEAIKYFRSVAPGTGPRDDNPDNVWWIYNADDVLRRRYDHRIIAKCHTPQAAIDELTCRYGGEWSYYREF